MQAENREPTAQIAAAEATIDRVRIEIATQIDNLEDKLADSIDWRLQYRRHPGAFLGTAVGLGYLLGRLL